MPLTPMTETGSARPFFWLASRICDRELGVSKIRIARTSVQYRWILPINYTDPEADKQQLDILVREEEEQDFNAPLETIAQVKFVIAGGENEEEMIVDRDEPESFSGSYADRFLRRFARLYARHDHGYCKEWQAEQNSLITGATPLATLKSSNGEIII